MLLFSKLHQDLRTRLRVLVGFIIGFGQFTNNLLQTKQLLFTKTNLKTFFEFRKRSSWGFYEIIQNNLKDTLEEKVPSYKTQTHSKRMNMDILVVGLSNQFFIRGS